MRLLVATGLVALTALSLAFHPREARADNPDPGALFDKGLADMQAHQYATGCPELAESYRLDPHAGGLFTLAECESEWGKIASAINDYDGFLDMYSHLPAPDRVRQGTRAKVAAEKRTALAREVPKVTLTLDHDVATGSTVTLDGKSIPESSFRMALPVDPGAHTVILRSPDGRSNEQHVTVALGESKGVMLTMIKPTVAAPAVVAPVEPPSESTPPHEARSSRNTVVFATAGAGGAVLVAGLILGAIVLVDKATIDKNCPTPSMCASSSDASSANSAKTLGWVSTGAVGVGLAGIGAAIAIRLKWPKASTSSSTGVLEPYVNGAGLGLRGSF